MLEAAHACRRRGEGGIGEKSVASLRVGHDPVLAAALGIMDVERDAEAAALGNTKY